MQLEILEKKELQKTLGEDFPQLISSFLTELDTKETTKNSYKKALERFFFYLGESKNSHPQLTDVLAYKKYLAELELSPHTVSSYLVAVRRFFEWTDTRRIYPNIAKSVKSRRTSGSFEKDPMTVGQVTSLLQSIDTSTVKGKRDFALLTLLVGTGLRTIEVVRSNIGDIRQQSGRAVLYIHRKGRDSKDRFVVLTSHTHRPIRDYLLERKSNAENEPLFASLSPRNKGERLTTRTIRRIVKKRLRGIGIDSKRITAHSLRHTSATLSLLNGASLQEVQSFLGHSNINTTLIYSHNIDRLKGVPEETLSLVLSGVRNG